MSAIALSHYKQLLADGMSEPDARQAAEHADAARARRFAEQLDQARAETVAERALAEKAAAEARAHANQAAAANARAETANAQTAQAAAQAARQVVGQAVAHSEAKAKARFVTKDVFHAAIRALPTREEMNAALAGLEQRMNARMDRIDRRIDNGVRILVAVGIAIFGALVSIGVFLANLPAA